MAGAAVLRVIEGGAAEPRVAFASAPPLAGVRALDRIPAPRSRWSTVRIAFAVIVSAGLHAGLVAWGLQHGPDEEARANGGSGDTVLTEGISVVLVDSLPSEASAGGDALPEARQVVALASAEPVQSAAVARPVESQAAPVDDSPIAAPVAAAATARAADTAVAAVSEDAAAIETSPVTAAVADSETAAASADAAPTVAADTASAAVQADAPLAPTGDATIAPDASRIAAPVEGDRAVARAADQAAETVAVAAASLSPSSQASTPDPATARPLADDVSRAVADTPAAAPQADTSRPVIDAPVANPDTDAATPVDDDTPRPVVESEVAAAAIEEPPPAEQKPPAAKPAPRTKPVARPRPAPAPRSEQRVASVAEDAAQGPAPGTAGAGGASSEERGRANLSGYQAKLAAHLRRYRAFPEEARQRRLSGVATVRFTVNAAGVVTSAGLARSSGEGTLDAAAVAMVHRASPFPPIPADLGTKSLTVNVPVRFDLR